MDDASIERMANRIAVGQAPDQDPLSELERLVADCRNGMASVGAGVSEGRLTEESMSRLWRALHDKARSACENLRSCKVEIDAVLPRTKSGWGPAKTERTP